MAVTSIWPIKGRVDQVITYARNPEKTTEDVSLNQAQLHAIDGVVEYAVDDIKTEQRCYVTGINCREDIAAKQFMETKEFWTRVTGQDKFSGRVCFHGYQSFAAGEVDAETAHEIGVRLATKLWGDDFEVIVATHCNTGHYHNHFVINSVAWSDGHKFHNGPEDYGPMREESDRLCMQYKISVIEDSVGRGRNYSEYLAEQNGKPTNRSLIRQDIDRAVAASMTQNEFFSHLQEMGYEIKINGEREKPLKYPALKPPGANGFFRFHKLGEGYSMDEIKGKILRNAHRAKPLPEEEIESVNEYRRKTEPLVKTSGLHALYIRYCYELHILTKYPASVKRVSFFMREDLTKLEKLDKQTQLLTEHKIETLEDLNAYRSKAKSDLSSLDGRRAVLRNELKKANRSGDEDDIARIKGKITDTTAEMKKLRESIKLCDAIEERSKPMEEELQKLKEEQEKTTGKEREQDEQLLRGRGRAGRENDSGRH